MIRAVSGPAARRRDTVTALRAIPEDLLDRSTSFPASLDALRQSLAETELPETVVAHLVAQARPALVLATSAADEDAIPWRDQDRR